MSLEAALYDRVSGFAGLTALLAADGIYKDVVPGEAAEGVNLAYQLISGIPISAANDDTEWTVARVQFTIVGGDQDDKIAVAAQLKLALKRYSGIHAGITLGDVRLENELDLPYDHLTNEIAREIDFMIYYHE